jgi:hypothetical protein
VHIIPRDSNKLVDNLEEPKVIRDNDIYLEDTVLLPTLVDTVEAPMSRGYCMYYTLLRLIMFGCVYLENK